MTMVWCPTGCGGSINTAVSNACSKCGADLTVTEIPYSHPERCDLRTKGPDSWGCHKRKGHTTGNGGRHCSTHTDCGYRFPNGGICDKEPGHDGDIHEAVESVPVVSRQPNSPDAVCKMIEEALLSYRCAFTRVGGVHEEEGLPLVDMLTPPCDSSIKRGKEEVERLAEHLFDNLPSFDGDVPPKMEYPTDTDRLNFIERVTGFERELLQDCPGDGNTVVYWRDPLTDKAQCVEGENFRDALDGALSRDAGDAPKVGSGPGSNTGHGHVWERPDGVKMRCGGPGICTECSRDAARPPEVKCPLTFNSYIRRTQPLLSAAVLPEHLAIVRDGMALAWDVAIDSALAYVPAEDYPRAHADIASLRDDPVDVKSGVLLHRDEKP